MQFVTLAIGGPDVVFPLSTVLVEPFTLAAPANAAGALLQRIDLSYPDGDHNLLSLQIDAITRFVPGQSAGFVEVRFNLDSGSPDDGPIGVALAILVVAE